MNATLGNVNADPNQQAVDEAARTVADYGYGQVRVVPDGKGGWSAITTKVVGANQYAAQAVGRSPKYAADALVRVITRS